MYCGKETKELNQLREQYKDVFGYDPNGDMELQFGDCSYKEYISLLKKCIETKKDIFAYIE